MLYYKNNLKYFSRKLRSNMTDAEKLLWNHVRRKQLCDIQFYRQKPIGKYIVDFYAPIVKLVIEVDGGQHFFKQEIIKDYERDRYLASLDLIVLRFDNLQVLKSLKAVLNEIYQTIEKQQSLLKNPPACYAVDPLY